MATSRHQRSESSESNSSSGGSAYQLILDHILSYPTSYEIPLRTMYTLNCAPRAQPSHGRSNSPTSTTASSPTTPQCPYQDDKTAQAFSENVMAQLSQQRRGPDNLPPSFITGFVQRCFPAELVQVDFPQALTGLDYLKDLETRRRKEVAAAMSRLGIDGDSLDSTADSFSSRYPNVSMWVAAVEERERKIDALYTQLYVGLRRWILINELSLLPFNKHNCVAMLNTLYPPATLTPPTTRLTQAILRNQRDGFFKYIQSVEKSGPRILGTLMQQGKAQGDDNGWIAVTRTLSMYLQLANSMISECVEVKDVQSVSPRKGSDSKPSKHPRKVDSGVSFNLSEGTSTRSNSIAEPVSPTETARPETARPETARPKTPSSTAKSTSNRPRTNSGAKHGTALEKIARGLKTIGRGRTEVTEMITDETPPPPPPQKTSALRKMRSMGHMDARLDSKTDLSATRARPTPEGKRQAGVVAAQKYGVRQSHEV